MVPLCFDQFYSTLNLLECLILIVVCVIVPGLQPGLNNLLGEFPAYCVPASSFIDIRLQSLSVLENTRVVKVSCSGFCLFVCVCFIVVFIPGSSIQSFCFVLCLFCST